MKKNMKKMFSYGLFFFLMVCSIPVGAYTAVDDGFDVWQGYPASFNICANDIPQPDPLMINTEITDEPTLGWITHDTSCAVTYHPYESYYYGPDSFKYRIYDGNAYSNEATVNVTLIQRCTLQLIFFITPVNTRLYADDNQYLMTCSGAGDKVKSVELIAGARHGKVEMKLCPLPAQGFGCFEYMPDTGFTGWDNFTIREIHDDPRFGTYPGKATGAMIFVGTDPFSTPEFPSIVLPATLILGVLGAVLVIRRTRDL
jgi:hypothetical protein